LVQINLNTLKNYFPSLKCFIQTHSKAIQEFQSWGKDGFEKEKLKLSNLQDEIEKGKLSSLVLIPLSQ